MANLPRFSHESWIIDFLFTNIVFTVLTMLEFTFISYLDWRKQFEREQTRKLAMNSGAVISEAFDDTVVTPVRVMKR